MQAFGVNVPLLVTLTFGAGVALAALGRRARGADHQVTRLWVEHHHRRVRGRSHRRHGLDPRLDHHRPRLGVIEGLTGCSTRKHPATVVFVVMVIVLLVRPAGLFGKGLTMEPTSPKRSVVT